MDIYLKKINTHLASRGIFDILNQLIPSVYKYVRSFTWSHWSHWVTSHKPHGDLKSPTTRLSVQQHVHSKGNIKAPHQWLFYEENLPDGLPLQKARNAESVPYHDAIMESQQPIKHMDVFPYMAIYGKTLKPHHSHLFFHTSLKRERWLNFRHWLHRKLSYWHHTV